MVMELLYLLRTKLLWQGAEQCSVHNCWNKGGKGSWEEWEEWEELPVSVQSSGSRVWPLCLWGSAELCGEGTKQQQQQQMELQCQESLTLSRWVLSPSSPLLAGNEGKEQLQRSPAAIPDVAQVCCWHPNLSVRCCRWPCLSTVPSAGYALTQERCAFPSEAEMRFCLILPYVHILDHPHHRCFSPCIKIGFQLTRLQHLTLKAKQIKSFLEGIMHHFPLFDCVLSTFTSDHIIKI